MLEVGSARKIGEQWGRRNEGEGRDEIRRRRPTVTE